MVTNINLFWNLKFIFTHHWFWKQFLLSQFLQVFELFIETTSTFCMQIRIIEARQTRTKLKWSCFTNPQNLRPHLRPPPPIRSTAVRIFTVECPTEANLLCSFITNSRIGCKSKVRKLLRHKKKRQSFAFSGVKRLVQVNYFTRWKEMCSADHNFFSCIQYQFQLITTKHRFCQPFWNSICF